MSRNTWYEIFFTSIVPEVLDEQKSRKISKKHNYCLRRNKNIIICTLKVFLKNLENKDENYLKI